MHTCHDVRMGQGARGVDEGGGRRAFRNQLAVVAGIMPVIGFVLVVDRQQIGLLATLGTALPLVALVLAALVPQSVDPRLFALVLALDVTGIAFIRGDVQSIGVSALFVLPAMWAGYSFGLPGAASTTGVIVTLLWIGAPGEWDRIDTADTARLVSFPLIVAAVSGTAAVLARRGAARQSVLHEQAALLRTRLLEVSTREALVRAVLDSVDFDVLAFDDRGRTTVTNRGRGGWGIEDLSGPGTERRLDDLVRSTIDGSEAEDELVVVRRPDGSTRNYTVNTRLLPVEGGGGVLVVRDVTAERRASSSTLPPTSIGTAGSSRRSMSVRSWPSTAGAQRSAGSPRRRRGCCSATPRR